MMESGTELDLATNDLGPLAWVLDELRKSLESASAALRRFVRDTGLARGTDMASVDAGQLRIARQQLHQAVGALEMVGLAAPAHMLRSMEAAVQRFVERPELCNEAGAAKVERAGFALAEYLESVLLGKAASSVALFPQYRDTQELSGADRVHPADLWAMEWRWQEPQTPAATQSVVYDPAVRSRLDQAVLRVVKSGDPAAARDLADLSLSLAATQAAKQPRVFWKICAGYFEALALSLLPLDIYVKRAASRIILQYATLAKGELGISDRLAQDLLFFCSQAMPADTLRAPALASVRLAWGLTRAKPVDYQTPQYGRFDPALLAQARKRIGVAKETWSALSGGDANKFKGVADQFGAVTDSIVKLHAPSAPLAQALTSAIEAVVRSGKAPSAEIAMEVATSVLYLEAAFEDLDPADTQLATRTSRLAERLDRVRQGGLPEPLEPWMEELYRRVSDRQTMGSVVGELRGTLAELEKLLDQYFRQPDDKKPLQAAPGHLLQMRGVLSVLGLDHASHAVQHMREAIEQVIVADDTELARANGTFDKLGDNLGALGFLIDMLNYQPALAKKLFVYDSANGELRPLMGRVGHGVPTAHEEDESSAAEVEQLIPAAASGTGTASAQPDKAAPLDFASTSKLAPVEMPVATAATDSLPLIPEPMQAGPAPTHAVVAAAAVPPAANVVGDDTDDELLGIFLEEAREVVQNGLAAIDVLATSPSDLGELTTLRRAFHTLKGSSRMVGLSEFGEAAWSLEQVLNTWLADQKPASEELRTVSADAMQAFGRWVEDIAAGSAGAWTASMFRGPADALRTEGRAVALAVPGASVALAESAPERVESVAIDATAAADVEISIDPELEAPIEPDRLESPTANAVHADALAAEIFSELPSLDLGVFESQTELPAASSQSLEAPVDNAVPATADVLIPDFDLEPTPTLVLGATAEPAAESAAEEALALPEVVEIEGIDFDQLLQLANEPDGQIPPPAIADAQQPDAINTHIPTQPEEFTFELPAASDEFPEVAQPSLVAEETQRAAGAEESTFLRMPDEPAAVNAFPVAAAALSDLADGPEIEAASTQVEAQGAVESSMDEQEAESGSAGSQVDDQIKVIGHLRIGIPLYNVYLNEADEWSRRLATELAEWALETNERVADSTVGWAHALAGSSATVGFDTLSDIARALESTLLHTQGLAYATPRHAHAFTDAADEIRRLLHQFAAGFLKEPTAGLIDALESLKSLEIPPRAERQERDDFELEHIEVPEDAASPAVASLPNVSGVARAAPIAHTFTGSDVGEDDIDVTDAIDPDLFPIFEEEAVELLPQLGAALRQWSSRPENRGARDEVLRALHTLKGSARLAGALRLGELAHRMESEIESIGSENLRAADIEPIVQRFDGIQTNFDRLRHGAGDAANGAAALSVPEQDAASSQPTGFAPEPAAPTQQRALIAQPVATNIAPRASANQAVRVRSQLLDRLVNQAGEVMITRSRLESELRQLRGSLTDLTGNLDRLRSQLRDIELQAESQMQSRLAQAKDSAAGFDPLEFDRFTRVQELTRMMAESVNDVATVQRNLQRTVEATEDDLVAQARQTRDLQRDLLRTRMVEFEGIADRLYRVIRLASKETGKQVKLDIAGGSIEMDRGVLDRMTPAFEHLLRNCVAHGIEDPAIRQAAGKDPAGTILITLLQEGNDVSVEFRDDGAGLNLPRIRDKAQQLGLVQPGHVIGDDEAAQLIFTPGFSTAGHVTELAGRGIGMDVVRAEVNALGGRIETKTVSGQGTSFRLVLPLTTAVTQVVMVRSGNLAIGVPANLVEIVRRATSRELEQAYNSGQFEFGGEQIPFHWSGALLQSSSRSNEPQGKTLPVVVFRSAAQRVAVHVDEVLGNQEVVVKNLGPQLARLPGLAGMTVLASGAVVLIYNPVALTAVYGEQARTMSADRAQPDVLEAGGARAVVVPVQPAVPQIPLVLVVDDSITVRRVTQRLLQREGYRVALAADGLQALERLAEERPAVVLSDIEMPRMDGFDLARNIRADQRWSNLPIVMITSRIAEKHREHARELGVDHYLGKPYSEEELMSLVRHYCGAAAQIA